MRNFNVQIGDHKMDLAVEGEVAFGDDEVLLLKDDNLIANTPWADRGFNIERFLDDAAHDALRAGVERLFLQAIEKHLGQKLPSLDLSKYHEVVDTDEKHLTLVHQTREGFPLHQFPVDVPRLEARISEILGIEVCAQNPFIENQVFFIRVIRPGKLRDNNPPHRDVWLTFYRNAVNIYVPIAGSNERSSLPMMPGTHLWKESEIQRTTSGAKVSGLEYRVSTVTDAKRPIAMERPNPGNNQMVVFSPYLIHGGGVNLNEGTTRMSLEMRFWRKHPKS